MYLKKKVKLNHLNFVNSTSLKTLMQIVLTCKVKI